MASTPSCAPSVFLSTPSARRATDYYLSRGLAKIISIHALREEGDTAKRTLSPSSFNFYPRPPRGGRQPNRKGVSTMKIFLSTPSARRATPVQRSLRTVRRISIHALREEGDYFQPCFVRYFPNFYPRPPRGGRQRWGGVRRMGRKFLSTPSARRATAKTETKSLFSNKLYNILHEFRRALIYNGSKNYPNHAK